MQRFEMKRLKGEQIFFPFGLNQKFDALLISSDYLWLKPEFLHPSLALGIELLQIILVECYYHNNYYFGCKDNNNFLNSQKIEFYFAFMDDFFL
jgi:hypothetical protein